VVLVSHKAGGGDHFLRQRRRNRDPKGLMGANSPSPWTRQATAPLTLTLTLCPPAIAPAT